MNERRYRIEERTRLTNRCVAHVDFPDKPSALAYWDTCMTDARSGALYAANAGPYRLVLVGPDHCVLPGGAR